MQDGGPFDHAKCEVPSGAGDEALGQRFRRRPPRRRDQQDPHGLSSELPAQRLWPHRAHTRRERSKAADPDPWLGRDKALHRGGERRHRGRRLWRRRHPGGHAMERDGSGSAQELDPSCRAAPAILGELVYFAGGADGLYRRHLDGSGSAQQDDDRCGDQPTVAGDYVYFRPVGRPSRLRSPPDSVDAVGAPERRGSCLLLPVATAQHIAGARGTGPAETALRPPAVTGVLGGEALAATIAARASTAGGRTSAWPRGHAVLVFRRRRRPWAWRPRFHACVGPRKRCRHSDWGWR